MDIKGTGDQSLVGEVNISALSFPGIELDLSKLIDPTAKGIDKVFNTLFGKRYVKQIRHIALSAAQTNADIKKIEQGLASYNPEERSLTEHAKDFKSLIVSSIQDEEITNILRCAIFAAGFIDEDGKHSEPSRDFINKWRNDAKQINSEELQIIWGGILSSQINTPDSVSLRTLDIIKNMTPQEAQLFYKASKNTLWDKFVSDTEDIDINILNEAGVIFAPLHSAGFGSGHDFPKKTFPIRGIDRECYYLETEQDIFLIPLSEITTCPNAPGWNLSSSGQELLKVIRQKIINYDENLYIKSYELVLLSIGRKTTPKGKSFTIKGYHSKVTGNLEFKEIILKSQADEN